jgi:hypothetical protein
LIEFDRRRVFGQGHKQRFSGLFEQGLPVFSSVDIKRQRRHLSHDNTGCNEIGDDFHLEIYGTLSPIDYLFFD